MRETLELSSRDRLAYGILGEALQVGVCLGAEVDPGGEEDVEMEDAEEAPEPPVDPEGRPSKKRPRKPAEVVEDDEDGAVFQEAASPPRRKSPWCPVVSPLMQPS